MASRSKSSTKRESGSKSEARARRMKADSKATAADESQRDPSGLGSGRLEESAEAAEDVRTKKKAGVASRFIHQAATVLEGEIAAGIKVAKKLEGKLWDVNEMRGRDPGAVMQRFRRDAHEVIDILVDVVGVAAEATGDLTKRAVTFRAWSRKAPPESSATHAAHVPVVNVFRSIHPGEIIEVPVAVENDGANPVDSISFLCTDFISLSGGRISSSQVEFQPHTVAIGPNSKAKVNVRLTVPIDTQPGAYSALFQATQLDYLRAVIVVKVQ